MTQTLPHASEAPSQECFSILKVLGWAVFLACSWTWCIGMFLPVLLVREYGVWGWIVFAVPNVIGAAAMGWVIQSPEQSRAIVSAQRHAILAFSAITAAFQLFFAAWIFEHLGLGRTFFVATCAAAALLALLGRLRIVAVLALVVSIIAAAAMAKTGELTPLLATLREARQLPSRRILPLTAVCFFGFILCPYLDATFHLARRQLNRAQARTAFTLGFVVIFFAIILFSLAYAPTLVIYMADPQLLAPRFLFCIPILGSALSWRLRKQ